MQPDLPTLYARVAAVCPEIAASGLHHTRNGWYINRSYRTESAAAKIIARACRSTLAEPLNRSETSALLLAVEAWAGKEK